MPGSDWREWATGDGVEVREGAVTASRGWCPKGELAVCLRRFRWSDLVLNRNDECDRVRPVAAAGKDEEAMLLSTRD